MPDQLEKGLLLKLTPLLDRYYSQGFGLTVAENYPEALKALRQAARIDPDDHEVHELIALVCRRMRRYEDEATAFREVVRLKPDYAEAHYNLGVAYKHLGSYRQAVASFKKAIALKPAVVFYESLGFLYLEAELYPQAIKIYQEILSLAPNHLWSRRFLGYTFEKLNHYDKAVEVYLQSLNLDPEIDGKLYYRLGWCYSKIGNYTAAIEAYKRALTLAPDNAEAHYALCDTYLSINDREAFREAYLRLRALDPVLADKLKDITSGE